MTLVKTLFSVLLLAAIGPGCDEVPNPHLPLPAPDPDVYAELIQPIVAEGCANLGCHGTPDRALTVYAIGYLRAPPTFPGVPLQEGTLTEAELTWNYDGMRARLLDEEDADDAALLLKCLDPAEGGIVHAGGVVVFEDRDDKDYVALRDWIAGGL